MPTVTFYADAADGQISKSGAVWATQRAAPTGDSRDKTSATVNATQVQEFASVFYIDRGFLTFDTSSIPDGAVISAANLYIYANSKSSSGLSDSLCIVESTQAAGNDLAIADFDAVGATELATRIAHSSISTGAYTALALNSSGLAVINKTGFTKIALRSARDLDNSAPSAGTYAILNINCSEQTSTSKDPYLEVTYVEGVSGGDTGSGSDSSATTVILSPSSDVFTDALTDTTGTVLSSHSPSSGSWAKWYPNADAAVTLQIRGNKLGARHSSTVIACTSEYEYSASVTDCEFAADITIPGAHNDGGYVCLKVRASGTQAGSPQSYSAYLSNGGYVTAGTIRLDKDVTAGSSALGNYTIGTLSSSSTYRLAVVARGDQISVKLNGVTVVGPFTDSALSGATKVRIGISTPNGQSDSVGLQVDNIQLTALTGGVETGTGTDSSSTPTDPSNVSKSGTETATGTDTRSTLLVTPQPGSAPIFKAGNRAAYGSQATIESPGAVGTNDAWHGGASIVHIPDGTTNGRLIAAWLNWVGQPFTYNPVPSGWEDGIWMSESTDLGATWGTPYQAIGPLTQPDMNCIAHMSYDPVRDKLLLVYYDIVYRGGASGASVPYDGALNANRCHYRECANASTGARTWSSDRILDGHTGYTDSDVGGSTYGEAAPHNLIVLPDGTYLLSLYGRDSLTQSYNLTYSRLMRSTDGGANWTAVSVIARSSQTNNLLNGEPAIVRLDTGRILCVMRVQDAVSGGSGAYFITHSDDNGLTWSTPTDIGFSVTNPNMPAIYQTLSGDVLLATNPPAGAYGVLVHQSKDRGATWSDAATFSPVDGGAYLGAMFAEATGVDNDGNVLVAWCEEQGGSPGTTGLWGASGGPWTVGGQALIKGWTKFGKLTSAVTNPGSAGTLSDTGSGSETSSISVGLGATAKTASDTATGTEARVLTITLPKSASDSGVAFDTSGGSTTVPTVTRIATPTSLYSTQFSNSTLQSAQFGGSRLLPADEHTVSTTT